MCSQGGTSLREKIRLTRWGKGGSRVADGLVLACICFHGQLGCGP